MVDTRLVVQAAWYMRARLFYDEYAVFSVCNVVVLCVWLLEALVEIFFSSRRSSAPSDMKNLRQNVHLFFFLSRLSSPAPALSS